MNNAKESSAISQKEINLILERTAQAKKDPKAFINYFVFTFNPKVPPYHLPFRLFDFQEEKIVDELVEAIEQGEDIFYEKCREMGASYTVLAVLLWYWLYIDGSNFLLGSRKEQYVDNRGAKSDDELSNKEESLFGKLDYMLSRLPTYMLPKGFDHKKHNTRFSLRNPQNGNVISGESSNQNFSRGGRFKAILLDEFAFWENDTAAWGSTGDTTQCRIIITTPGIRPSKAKRLRFGMDGEKIKVITLHYSLDPRKDQAWLDKQRIRRSAEDFAREIMIDWEGSLSGVVYGEIRYARLGHYPYIPNNPLFVTWDFGLDGVAFQYWQQNMTNGKMRLVDCYTNEDKPIQFYFPFHHQPIDSTFQYSEKDLEAIQAVYHLPAAVHFGDPDVNKRALVSPTLASTRSELEKIQIYVQTNPGVNSFMTRRDATKVLLQKGIEVNDTPRNRHWLECIKNSRYPKRDDSSQATTPISSPIHNWTSHHRTATEYFAVNYSGYVDTANADDDQEPEFAL